MLKLWLNLLVCVALLAVPLGTALAEGTLPSGLSDSDLAAAVDAYVDEHKDTTAAVSVAVMRGQETLFERAYGYADIAAGRATDEDTVYEWGSATKLLVWVSVMQLAEQGKLDLEADISAYLPDGFFTKLRYDTPLTMLNLMHHNAGWEDMLVGLFVDPAAATDNLEQALRRCEPNQIYAPGTVCAYSNWGVALAGLIVERVSGEPFADYVHRHIFTPLGMERTALSPTLSDNDWVREHRPLTQGYAELTPIKNQYAIPLYPAGMATGTLNDFARLAKALLPEDGTSSPLFVKPDTLAALLTPSLRYQNGDARNCHGFWVLDFGVPVIGHGGNTAAFSAYLLLDPSTGTGMVVMTNQANEAVYNSDMPELIFGSYEPPQTEGLMPDARELRGFYRSGRITLSGCAKIYGVLQMIPLFRGDENTLSAAPLIVFKQAAPDLLVIDDDSAIEPIEHLRAERTADGGVRLTMPYFEFVRIPTGEGVLWYAMLLLLALAMIYFAAALLGGGVRRFILRIRKRRAEHSPMRKVHLLMCVFGLAEGANIAWMAANLMSYASRLVLGLHIGFTWLYVAAAVAYLVLLALKVRRLACGRKEKALYVATCIAGLVMLMNIAFWQFYRF